MLIIPAIDIIDGKCVRLYKGDYSKVTNYSDSPSDVAVQLEEAGAERIHIVDLDAAKGGGVNNRKTISEIRKKTKALLELGGGIREDEDIKEILDIGIDRLILGTVFARNPETGAEWTVKYGKKFIAGIDALNGEVKVSGWEKGSGIKDTLLAAKAGEYGLCSIIYTNISRDGTLSGPDAERTALIADESSLPVIVSGGISCGDDFKNIVENSSYEGKIAGIITGKAFYENKFSLKDVIDKYQKNDGVFF